MRLPRWGALGHPWPNKIVRTVSVSAASSNFCLYCGCAFASDVAKKIGKSIPRSLQSRVVSMSLITPAGVPTLLFELRSGLDSHLDSSSSVFEPGVRESTVVSFGSSAVTSQSSIAAHSITCNKLADHKRWTSHEDFASSWLTKTNPYLLNAAMTPPSRSDYFRENA
jgi:hypothetical protein